MKYYKNSDMIHAINEWVHNPRYREVLRLKLCEDFTYEEIAGAVGFSPQHVKFICRSYREHLLSQV